MGVKIGTTDLLESYIGGSSRIAHFPLVNDTLDICGNSTLSTAGTKQSIGYQFDSNTNILNASSAKFISYWFKIVSKSGAGSQTGFIESLGGLAYTLEHDSDHQRMVGAISYFKDLSWSGNEYVTVGIDTGNWHNIAYGKDSNGDLVGYYDNVRYDFTTGTGRYPYGNTLTLLRIWNGSATVVFSDVILEEVAWDTTEYQQYYNQTKGNYGL